MHYNWAGHDQFCHSTFIYYANYPFATPTYYVTTISPTLSVINRHITDLPLISADNKDKKLDDNSNRDLSKGTNSTTIGTNSCASGILSRASRTTNLVTNLNLRNSPCVTTASSHLMNLYLSRNHIIGDIKHLLFNAQFKNLYDFVLRTNVILP